jgi:hypothetical protein
VGNLAPRPLVAGLDGGGLLSSELGLGKAVLAARKKQKNYANGIDSDSVYSASRGKIARFMLFSS